MNRPHSDNLWCEIVWCNMSYITCVIQHILTTYNVRCSTFWQLTNRRVSENELHRCKCYIWPCVTSVMFDSLRLPTDGGDRTLIVTTAKISYKFSRDSPYISNKFSRKSTRFQTCFHWSQRSPRDSKDVSGKLVDVELHIFHIWCFLHEWYREIESLRYVYCHCARWDASTIIPGGWQNTPQFLARNLAFPRPLGSQSNVKPKAVCVWSNFSENQILSRSI